MRFFLLLALAIAQPVTVWAQAMPRHAYTVLGEPALPAGFASFPYVNPHAPKGGEISLAATGTYDNFNPFILRGTAEAHGISSWVGLAGVGSGTSVGHVWESLLTGSADEASTGYGHLAESIEVPADKMWTAFTLRAEAKFSDGTPVTAEDVAWTFRSLIEKGRPSFRIQYADVKDVVVEGPRRVRFNFNTNQNRDLPLMVGGLPVLPKHFFETRDFSKPLNEAPVGSGPYRVSGFELGRSVIYSRDPKWWAAALPTGIGTNNFDRVRVEYFRDSTVAMEAFKAGKADIRSENISKNWATAYDFPAVKTGLVLRRDFHHQLPQGMQGWAMNTRRAVFADPRVRQAIGLAFDFEWTNKNLFYSAYTRTQSYFTNTENASSGLPSPAELALLEPHRATLPAALFTRPFAAPVTDGSGTNREQLKQALDLLREAGWKIKDRKLVDANDRQLSFTILTYDPSFERIALPYVQSLLKLGLDAKVRSVDPAQYQRLTDDYDFDMVMTSYGTSELPGNELRDYWSCAARDAKGGNNVSGICDKTIDSLIETIVAAGAREPLHDAARALDRVLLWNWYLVPNWHGGAFHIAHWDRFGDPGKPIREGVNFDTWWIDEKKAAHIAAARK